MIRGPQQLEFPTHGGRRKGAGRPAGERITHHARPAFNRITPSLVTLKVAGDVPSLRSSRRFAAIRECFAAARGRNGLRVVQFSVLGDHLHLIVEADSSVTLSRGMQGLCIRVAKAVNRNLRRRGRIFADHYHSRLLPSPTELVRAIDYVINNAEHHYGDTGADHCCSTAADAPTLLAPARGWLLRVGWQRGRPSMRVRELLERLGSMHESIYRPMV
jgi:REP-associated tyrosine transposase